MGLFYKVSSRVESSFSGFQNFVKLPKLSQIPPPIFLTEAVLVLVVSWLGKVVSHLATPWRHIQFFWTICHYLNICRHFLIKTQLVIIWEIFFFK